MVSLSDRIQRLSLSGEEISGLTEWPDKMIEDYLGILEDIQQLILVVDNLNLEELEERVEELEGKVAQIKIEIENINNEIDILEETKMPVAPEGALYLAESNEWQDSSVTAGNSLYFYSPDTTPTQPQLGVIKFDNIDLSLITQIYINSGSLDGLNYDEIMKRIARSDQIIMTRYGSPANHVELRVLTFAVDNAGWFTIDVESVNSGGGFLDGDKLEIRFFEVGDRKADIAVINYTDEPVSGNQATPTPIGVGNWVTLGTPNGITVDLATGALVNAKGRTIDVAVGTLSLQYEQLVGGNGYFNLAMQRSPDGITWSYVQNTLARFRNQNNDVIFLTTVTGISNWLNGEYVRFVAYTDGNTGQLYIPSELFEGVLVDGSSSGWTLTEQ